MRVPGFGTVAAMTWFSSITIAATVLVASVPAFAQEAAPTPSQTDVIIRMAPAQNPSREAWYQKDLESANTRIHRTRNALIWTSVVTGVGIILAGVGASQCQYFDNTFQNDQILCNTAGNVLLPLGGTMLGLGAIGMITSGIMLGVAKKRRRDIERDYRRSSYGRRLEWDPGGALRF